MFQTDTLCTTYVTPYDTNIPEILTKFMSKAKIIRFISYGTNLPEFYNGLIDAYNRGVDVQGIFDHTQSAGKNESAQLHKMFLIVPAYRFRIGTSPIKKQIIHMKGIYVNYADGVDIPESKQYTSWESAIEENYPVSWTGSYNFTTTAGYQINNVDIMPGILRAQAFDKVFRELWDYIDKNEKHYQMT